MYEDTNSTWDSTLHIAIPTLEYIKTLTGYNLETLGDTNRLETEQRVKGLTLKARNFLYQNKENEQTKKIYTYLIAFYQEYRDAFVNYVVTYIEETFNNPEWETIPMNVINAINGSVLKYNQFTGNIVHEYMANEEVY